MFGFLKDKLKKAISKFTTDVKDEVEEKVEVKEAEKPQEVKKEAVKKPEVKKPEVKPEPKRDIKPQEKKPKPELKKPEIRPKPEVVSKPKVEPKHEIKPEPKPEVVSKPKVKKAPEKVSLKPEEKKEVPSKIEEKKVLETEEKVIEEKIKPVLPEKKEEASSEKIHKKHVPSKVAPKVEEEKPAIETPKEKPEDKKPGFFGKLFSKKEEPKKEEQVLEKEAESEKEEKPEEKKGFFGKISEVVTKKTLSEEKFDELFFDLEVSLLENNVALEVIEKIKDDLKKSLLSEKVSRMRTEEVIANSLKESIDDLFDVETINIISLLKKKKPYVICFVGVNGSGKTTNLAKLANYLEKNGFSVVIGACDTFRAAAIQQIEEHAKNLGVKLIKHDYGADAAAVAFDAIEHAKAKGKDVVLIDTAGRSHANVNLMEELEKVIRVSKPDLKIFVGDSLTGNDAVEQAKTFNEKVGIDGIILSKVDVDEKGGAAISVSYVTKKPIIFIGTGQTYDDFEEFDKNKITQNLGF